MKKIVISTFLVLGVLFGFAQESRVLVRNAPNSTKENPSIQVKWYSSQFPFYKEGAHVYRREAGTLSWEKITIDPIAQLSNFDVTRYPNDENLVFFVDLVNSTTPQEFEEVGILLVNTLVKSFESEPFARFLGITYLDKQIEFGKRYEYRVNRLINGRETILAQSESIEAGPFVLNPPVEGFSAVQEDTLFYIDWNVDIDSYYAVNIYESRSDRNGDTVKINPRPLMSSEVTDSLGNVGYPSPKYKIDSLEIGEEYTYYVTGLDFFGSETTPTAPITLKFEDKVPPLPPTGLEGKADSMKVHLNWELPIDEEITQYLLYRSALSDGPFEVIAAFEGENTYTDFIDIPGPYYYFVASVDGSGNEASSKKIFIEVQDVIPPSQPRGLMIESDTGRFKLTWLPNNEEDLAGYLIYRTVDEAKKRNLVLLNSKPTLETVFEQELPKQVKNKFFYYIVALDTMHNRSKPSDFASARMPDVIAPERPHIKKITYDNEFINLEWIANVDRDLYGYHVYRLDSLGDKEKDRVNLRLIAADIVGFTDRTAEENTTYFYQVVALDSIGNVSEPSLPYSAFLKVDEFIDESLDVKLSFNQRKREVTLKWQGLSDQSGYLGYVIYAAEEGDVLSPLTALIEDNSFKEKLPEEVLEKNYQVRVYTNEGKVIKSNVLKMNKNE